ncbi:hypothetical protein [Stenotrophomonas sp.]|uniref:hypothetical protein n=1 Tax=Stenotrophomonas sp. TaxID=69392 RepID=UPI0028B112A9|nr:hypothetical protein [Stenotrophomonas sp.]
MNRIFGVLFVSVVVALGVWMLFFLPGWVGVVICGGLLLCATAVTVLAILGAVGRRKVARLWKEFFDSLYGV